MKRLHLDELLAYVVVGLFLITWATAAVTYFYLLFKLYL